jgi:hypothetical protein
MESLFGPLAHARRGNPDTSREAAEQITPRIRQLQAEVLRFAAGVRGFTDVELSDYFDARSSTYRTRRAGLVALGLIEDSGNRVGDKGRRHAVWRITSEGQAKVAEIIDLPRAA